MTARTFPQGFMWGTASSAYQTEGATMADGRGRSIWDEFCDQPGRIEGGANAQVACDSYHRFDRDLAALRELGAGAYRFSVAWPRIQRAADWQTNPAGLDHYERMVDSLLGADIVPLLTLYHWELPVELQQVGGWTNRETAQRFGDYAALVARRLGDRLDYLITLNEPWCSAFLGYANGEQAPGLVEPAASFKAAHHLNLAHGLAAQAVRAQVPDCRVTAALNLHLFEPASDSEADRAAVDNLERVSNDIWLLPMLEGRYDPALLADTAHLTDWSFVLDGDMALIHQPTEPLGLNYYMKRRVRWRSAPLPAGQPWEWPGAESAEILSAKPPLTEMGWSQDPSGLTDLLVKVHQRWPDLELWVSENGAAFADQLGPDGRVHDPDRVRFLSSHVEAMGRAMDQGVPVTAFLVWSLMDNFEWIYGYAKRFGLYYTDYPTQRRIPKDSALWYRQLVTTNQLPASA